MAGSKKFIYQFMPINISRFQQPLLPRFHTFLRNLKLFASSASNTLKWNSNTNLIITNPILLLIESCNSMPQLQQIQAHMTRTGLITHIFPVSRLLSFCALSHPGNIHHAHLLFTQIPHPNVYIYNTMIRGYSKSKLPKSSIFLFRWMVQEGVEMDCRTFVFALKACEQFEGTIVGEQLHNRIYKMGFSFETLVVNGLIHFYTNNGCLVFARRLFDEIFVRDVVSWTTMVNGYVQENLLDEGLRLFNLMLSSGVEPNEVTMITVLSSCSLLRNLRLGRTIHGYIEKKEIDQSVNLSNAILDMYAKCGCLSTAREIFDKIEIKDVYTWTSMIDCYAKQGDLEIAREFFNKFRDRNVVCWNAMIAGYSQHNKPKEALELFYTMQETSVKPVEATLVCVLSACAQLGCLDVGEKIYHYYVSQKRVRPSVSLANAFIDMCAKGGSIDAAVKFFNEMPEKNLVSWNSMIVGYAVHGYAEQSLNLFNQMKSLQLKPDDITLVGVLSACSHGGFVRQGLEYFENMRRDFGLEPKAEHYACVIDLLGRVGRLEEAFELIKRMPMEPDEAAWGALLNACKMHGNVDLGKFASVELLNLVPEDSGVYVLLATIYAGKKRWDDVRMARSMMRTRGVKKMPGRSSVEVDGKSHEFLAADESHPKSKEIYQILADMFLVLKLEGYVAKPPLMSQT